ncbi:MAG: LamG-like jellyroll fold domain-containing protein, partial [Verrucomicrobiota bacterium]
WKGQYGNQAQLDTYNDFGDGLHGDGHAIWPGGFNYDNEDGFIERFWQTRVMAGIRADMGILSFTREARNDAVAVGATAEFRVESPTAATFRWQKNGATLNNGGDISGANTATLRIANAEAADAGTYRCVVTGAGETLNSRPRQLWVHAAPQLGQWDFNGNANSGINGNHGAAVGSPAYVAGKIGQAVDLDGADDYIDLPDAVGRTRDITVATWVNWDGGNNWQRVFDFGSGTFQYLFLSPKSGDGTMRLALKDTINGRDVEYQVNTTALPTAQWVHLAVVLKGGYMTLYVNGQPKGSNFEIGSSPAAFPATNNYIGKSQYPDPLFNGRIDDFRIHGKALTGAEVWTLWGQSANRAPVFNSAVITLPPVNALEPFTGQTLAAFASDADGNALTFTKLQGPSWLTVAANGALSGQPAPRHAGLNTFIVRLTDPSGATSDATLQVQVSAPAAAPVTASSAAPTIDKDDVYYLPGNIAESGAIDGTTASGDNDESTYAAENRTSKGQTFTTGSSAQGYFLQSFSFQHVNWPAFTANGTTYDIQPGDQWELQVGTMSGSVKTPGIKYVAVYDGGALTGAGNSGTGRFLTFNVSGLGVQLAPNTTYYFEIAPLTGEPYFELNSSRTGTYNGGTAFRGSGTGTIDTGVNPLAGDFAFHANLEAKTSTAAGTVAYWNFEEGTSNSYVPYARTTANQYQGSIFDQSGNANHLSVWDTNWHWHRSQVPGATTPRTGAVNTLSIQNAGSFPGISSISTPLTSWSPAAWTIEAAIRPDDATAAGFQTFIGRDSLGAANADPALAALYFQITPTGALQFAFTDAAGNAWTVTSAANAIQDAKWHAVAATSNGSTLSLYRKNITNGEASYTLLGSVNISASANPAISTGNGNGSDWDAGVFTVARGLFNGVHTDRFFGHIDDIRFSNGVLAPAELLYNTAPLTPAQTWRQTYFGTTSNTGNAADSADPDRDGVINLLERALAGSPAAPDAGILPIIDPTAPFLTITYTRAKGLPELTLTVQESSDPAMALWTAAGGTEVVTDLGAFERVRFTVDPGTAGRKFLRLQVIQTP